MDWKIFLAKELGITSFLTLTAGKRFLDRHHDWSDEDFSAAFYEMFPLLKSVDTTDLAVIGGCVFDFLTKRQNSIKDIDIFVIGEKYADKKLLIERAAKFLDDIKEVLLAKDQEYEEDQKRHGYSYSKQTSKYNLSNLEATRNGCVVTISVPTMNYTMIQFILSPIPNLQSFFQKNDLGCTALAFYHDKVYFSELGKFCFQNSLCLVLPDDLSYTGSSRIKKYFDKGVDLVLPHLSREALPTRNFRFNLNEVFVFDNLAVIYSSIQKNKIRVHDIEVCDPEGETPSDNLSDDDDMSDDENYAYFHYDSCSEIQGNKLPSENDIIHENLIKLIRERRHFKIRCSGKEIHDVLKPVPIPERMITNTYDTIQSSLESMINSGEYKLSKFQYFSVCPSSEILHNLIVKPERELEEKLMESKGKTSNNFAAISEKFRKQVKSRQKLYLEDLINQQKQCSFEKAAALQKDVLNRPNYYPIVSSDWKWNENSGPSMLTWYGTSYNKDVFI
ncbi:hypothetical protein CTEN210_01620 [Chaetoceros tenuissimus]|uniref:Uncharacterized protein n=1 Tax=Chaetoceros tenuissimus TaxID=426638 RepID=A0AAD3CG14_9STRA|nr:hypothetical protein CTEN210_01620 [Chaetoceros tenuissimus]